MNDQPDVGKLYDVIIAGAGPIGLFLAHELGLTGTSVLVLERDPTPDSLWKVEPLGFRGLNTSSVEAFYRRGLFDELFADEPFWSRKFEKKPGFQFGGHFAGIPFNVNQLDLSRHPYKINGPALLGRPTTIAKIESLLEKRIKAMNVTILKGSGLQQIVTEDDCSVVVETQDEKRFRGRWLVGCDGGRSIVRKLAGFDFVGTDAKFTGYAIDCDLKGLVPEKLKPGFVPTSTGMYINRPPNMMYLVDFDGGAFDRGQEITKDHLTEVMCRVSGRADIKMPDFKLAGTFTDRTKQATKYRRGRVLLCGDAAHIHPPLGGQGLNLGIGDAMNLGWKLAATVKKEIEQKSHVDMALVDTYEEERHPVGEWLMGWTRAQVLTLEPGAHGAAMQGLIRDLVATDDGANMFMDHFFGLSLHYNLGQSMACKHPLIGHSVPDFELQDGSRLGSQMSSGKGLLLELEDNCNLERVLNESAMTAKVDFCCASVQDRRGISALLSRPDGFVVWVAEDNKDRDLTSLHSALQKWFR